MTATTFDESKVRRDKDGRFIEQNKRHAPGVLPEPIGRDRPVSDDLIHDADKITDSDQYAHECDQRFDDMDLEQAIDDKYRNGFGDGAESSDTARNRLMMVSDMPADKDALSTLAVAMDYSPKYESLSNMNMMMPDTDVDYYPDHWEASTDQLVRQAADRRGVNPENTRRMITALNEVADHCRNDDNQASLAIAQIAVGHLALGENHRAVREAREALDYVDKRSDTYTAKARTIVQSILTHARLD